MITQTVKKKIVHKKRLIAVNPGETFCLKDPDKEESAEVFLCIYVQGPIIRDGQHLYVNLGSDDAVAIGLGSSDPQREVFLVDVEMTTTVSYQTL